MGICESSKNHGKLTFNYPKILHEQLNQVPPNYAYKFDFPNIKNTFNKTYNLKFTFGNFKIKHCISHKPDKSSQYLTEIRIGDKAFPLVVNSGQSPNIPNPTGEEYSIEKEFKFSELENTYLLIDIYEYTEQIPSIHMSLKEIPNQYKAQSKYYSFFRISLSSFLFKSENCDFPLMGNGQLNQLSTKARISFNCHIEQKEKIRIDASNLIVQNNPNIHNINIRRLVFEYKDTILACETRLSNGLFTITTPPLTMREFVNSNIFLETNEDENYQYISLNALKDKIIRNLGQKVIKYTDMIFMEKHIPIDMNTITPNGIMDTSNNINYGGNNYMNTTNKNPDFLKEYEEERNEGAVLYIFNLPIFSQVGNLYFTEYGNLYNSSVLNIINDDAELHNFRKNKQISSDDFIGKLTKYYEDFLKPDYNLSVLNDIQILLMRSIDSDKFMFIYPTFESLSKMIILMMNLGIAIINSILNSTDEYKTITLIKLINTLMKREELDNGVLYYFFNNYPSNDITPRQLYNQLNIYLLYLYTYLMSNKAPSDNDDPLIELFARLYFKKTYFRKLILSTLCGKEYEYKEFDYNIFIYDELTDEKLNHYLTDNSIGFFKEYYRQELFFKSMQFDKFRLFKIIVCMIKDAGIYEFPLSYGIFYDIESILKEIGREINYQKIEDPTINSNHSLNNDFYEMLMLFSLDYYSISYLNSILIQATNAHNQYAVYTLYIYFKSLFEYHYSLTNSKLIFDYNLFEKASEILVIDEDSVSLPRLFWFYYTCHHLILSNDLKWFFANIISKNFDKFAYHWSFTIRQVYFKLIVYAIYNKLKEKEGKVFNRQKLTPFLNANLNENVQPYIYQSIKDFNTIRKEYNFWVSRTSHIKDAELPVFNLPPPTTNVVGGD